MERFWRVTTPFSDTRSIMLVTLLAGSDDTDTPLVLPEEGPQEFHWMFFGVEQWTEEERDTVERVLAAYQPEEEGIGWRLSKKASNRGPDRYEFVATREGTGYRDARCIASSAQELAGQVRAAYEQMGKGASRGGGAWGRAARRPSAPVSSAERSGA